MIPIGSFVGVINIADLIFVVGVCLSDVASVQSSAETGT